MAEAPFRSKRFQHLEDIDGNPIEFGAKKSVLEPVQASAPSEPALAENAAINEVRDEVRGQARPGESADVDPRLATFWRDYEKDGVLKGRIAWTEIQTRLLANNGHYLALAQAMEQGGELFGVDSQGNPLISDRGDEPIMKGTNYKNTRDRVLYQHDGQDRMIRGGNGQPVSTGYEMFPYSGDYDKSPEILQYEAHTGKLFVKGPNGREWRSSWLESGEAPSWPRYVYYLPYHANSYVSVVDPEFNAPGRGGRRLLRVRNA